LFILTLYNKIILKRICYRYRFDSFNNHGLIDIDQQHDIAVMFCGSNGDSTTTTIVTTSLEELERLHERMIKQYWQQKDQENEEARIAELERSFRARGCPINPALYNEPVKRRRSSRAANLLPQPRPTTTENKI